MSDAREGFNLEQRFALDKMAAAFPPFILVIPSTGRIYGEGCKDPLEIEETKAMFIELLHNDAAVRVQALRQARQARAVHGPRKPQGPGDLRKL